MLAANIADYPHLPPRERKRIWGNWKGIAAAGDPKVDARGRQVVTDIDDFTRLIEIALR